MKSSFDQNNFWQQHQLWERMWFTFETVRKKQQQQQQQQQQPRNINKTKHTHTPKHTLTKQNKNTNKTKLKKTKTNKIQNKINKQTKNISAKNWFVQNEYFCIISYTHRIR